MAQTVFPPRQVAHLWANGHTDYARNSGRTFYTQNGKLYSYGSHFIIGAFVKNKAGAELLLWNDSSYSNSTNRHQSHARQALTSFQWGTAVRVPGMKDGFEIAELARDCVIAAREPMEKSDKARQNRDSYLSVANDWFSNARKLFEFCGKTKDAASVPTIPADADKAAVKAILADAFAFEYLEQAREKLNLANDYIASVARNVAAGQPIAIVSNAKSAIDFAERAQYLRKQAGKPASRAIAKLIRDTLAVVANYQDLADAEAREIKREDVRIAADAARTELAEMPRNFYYVGRLEENLRGADADQIAEYGPMVAKARRISKGKQLAIAARMLRADIANYHEAESAGARYNNVPVPGGFVRDLSAAKSAGCRVAYFERIGAELVSQAQAIRVEYESREATRNAEAIAAWRAGESVRLPHSVPTMARIVGANVETSRGAIVPLEHAQRLVRIVRRVLRGMAPGSQIDYGTDGPMVGHFRVASIAADGRVVIGCHDFSEPETSRLMTLIEASISETV